MSFDLEKSILIHATQARVFSALTTSEKIPNYYPLESVESDWQVGSEILYKGQLGGVPFTDYGIIEKIESPAEYCYRYWSDNHGTERLDENYVTIRYLLSPAEDAVQLTLFQSNIPSRELYALMKDQVWDYLLSSLKRYVEEG